MRTINPSELTVGGTVNQTDIENRATGENKGMQVGYDPQSFFPKVSPPVNQDNTTPSTTQSGLSSNITLLDATGNVRDIPHLQTEVDNLNETLADPMAEDLDAGSIFLQVIAQETLSEWGAEQIGDFFTNSGIDDPVLKQIVHVGSHALLGCAAGAIGGDCGGGALGHAAGEMAAEFLSNLGFESDDVLDGVQLFTGVIATASGQDTELVTRLAANAAEFNFLNHKEATERAELQALIDARECSTSKCTDERKRIKELNELDAFRDKAIAEACDDNPSSEACAGWVALFQVSQESFGAGDGSLLDSAARTEYRNNIARLDQYKLRVKNPALYGAMVGLLKSGAGVVIGTAELALLVAQAASGDPEAAKALGQIILSLPDVPAEMKRQWQEAKALEATNPAKAAEIRATIVADVLSMTAGGASLGKAVAKGKGEAVDDVAAAAGKTCSFHGDTQVLTRTGYRAIRDLTENVDQVWARDEQTGDMDWKAMEAHYSNPYPVSVSVTLKDAETAEVQTIVSNRIHPYFAQFPVNATQIPPNSEGHDYQGSIQRGQWVDAQHLKVGYRLLNPDESWAEVTAVQVKEAPLTAYNLTVADFHTYFVAGNFGAPAVWVHNDCPGIDILRSAVDSRKGNRLHGDISLLKNAVRQIGYDKKLLLEAQTIFENSLATRRDEKKIFGRLDENHRKRIKWEQEILDVINKRLKD